MASYSLNDSFAVSFGNLVDKGPM
ncbi:hypothetical protein ED21_22383 [Erythrobacter sp. SD-21]|nr:hypothetical protein ED21_32235 [Erythrobacter sp. SD-21]EDL47904.1 hypothetical protein ED21_22383 [Erythrobacter sp. SD-21]